MKKREKTNNSRPPLLQVTDKGITMDIDICIPGITKNKVEVFGHRPCVKQSAPWGSRQSEFLHLILANNRPL